MPTISLIKHIINTETSRRVVCRYLVSTSSACGTRYANVEFSNVARSKNLHPNHYNFTHSSNEKYLTERQWPTPPAGRHYVLLATDAEQIPCNNPMKLIEKSVRNCKVPRQAFTSNIKHPISTSPNVRCTLATTRMYRKT